MDIKVYESIDDAKEYVKTDLQAEKDSLSKKGIEPDIISSDELLFTQLMDQDSNHLVYWKIIQTGLIPKTTPNIPSSAPQPVAVEQNKPPLSLQTFGLRLPRALSLPEKISSAMAFGLIFGVPMLMMTCPWLL